MSEDQQQAAPIVVLVDDDEAVRNAVRFSLELDGFSVRSFTDGEVLFDRPELCAGSCLVIDYHMPELNGLDLLRVLRGLGITAPAILITADASDAVRLRARSNGVLVVEKPALADLSDKVRELLAASGNRPAGR